MVVCISESSLRQRSAQWKERDTRRSLSNERLSAIDLWVPFDCKSGAFCRVRDATKRTTIAWIVERFVWNARVRRLTPNETHKHIKNEFWKRDKQMTCSFRSDGVFGSGFAGSRTPFRFSLFAFLFSLRNRLYFTSRQLVLFSSPCFLSFLLFFFSCFAQRLF